MQFIFVHQLTYLFHETVPVIWLFQNLRFYSKLFCIVHNHTYCITFNNFKFCNSELLLFLFKLYFFLILFCLFVCLFVLVMFALLPRQLLCQYNLFFFGDIFSEDPWPYSKYNNNNKDIAIFMKSLALVNIIIIIKIQLCF